MNFRISKKLSIITSTALLSTLLIPLSPQQAQAVTAADSTSVAAATQSVVYPTIKSFAITKTAVDTVTLTASLSESLETNGNTLYLYKDGSSNIEKEVVSGSTIELTVNRPASGMQGYYVSVGDKISQSISVESITNNSWNLALQSDKTSFSTNAGTASSTETLPKITWKASKSPSANSKTVYIADSAGNIIFNSASSGYSFTIPKFYEDEEKYKAYVADQTWYAYKKKVSDLSEIVSVSNEITIMRDPYSLELRVNLDSYTVSDNSIIFDYIPNQIVDGGYGLYIVDEDSGKIVSFDGWSNAKNQLTIKALYDGRKRSYKAYIAKNPSGNREKAGLQSIKAISNLVTTDHKDWAITATTNNPSFYTDEETPRIYFTLNQKTDNPNDYATYRVSFVDITNNKTFYTTWVKDLQGSQPIDRFWFEKEKQFKMVVSKVDCTGACKLPTSSLYDIQAESNVVTIKRAPWSIKASTSQVNGHTIGEGIYVAWETNQSASWVHTGPVDYDNNYAVFRYREGKEGLFQLSPQNYTDPVFSGNTQDIVAENETHKYTFYIARKSSTTVKRPEDLVDVQAVSNSITVSPKKWNVSIEKVVEDKSFNTATIDVKVNQYIWNSKMYRVHIVDANTGKVLQMLRPFTLLPNSSTTGSVYVSVPSNSNIRYVAYIAEKSPTSDYTSDKAYASQFTDVRATSNDVFSQDALQSDSADYSRSGRFQSGANPSTSDCKQVCHGDPVNTFSGELFENSTDLSFEGGLPLTFARSFSTFRKDNLGSLGYGWSSNYDLKLKGDKSSLQDSQYITVIQENGSEVVFSKSTDNGVDSYIASTTVKATLKFDADSGKFIFERNNGLKMTFNGLGKIESISNRLNQKIDLFYDEAGLLKSVKNDTSEITLVWNNNLISSVTDGANTVSYSYENGNLVSVKSSRLDADKKYTYLDDHKISKIIHPNGGVYESFYDSNNRVVQQINPLGDSTYFSYSSTVLPSVTTITLPNGEKTVEKYNTYGRLYERILGFGTTEAATYKYTYYSSGDLVSEDNPGGKGMSYRYDLAGNIIMATDPLARVTRFIYNEQNQLIETINPLGNRTTNVYDEKGLLIKTVYPDGGEKVYENDSQNRMKSSQSPQQQADSIKTLYSYGSNGLVSSVTDTLGASSRIEYDSARNVKKSINSLNVETSFEYLNNNLLSKVTYGDSSKETYEYDSAGRVTKKTNKNGNSTSYIYDKMDNVVSITNDYGTTTFKFDKNQKLESTKDPKGLVTSYTYTALGQVKDVTQTGDRKSSFTYTNQGLLKSKTDYLGNTTSYTYDAVGNIITVTDALGKISSFAYNKLNQVVSETSPLGKSTNYSYNSMGLVSSKTESNLRTTRYSYDLNQNLIKTTFNDGSFETRKYDSENQLTSVTDRNGKTESYVYDSEGQMTKKVRSDGSEVSYTYDAVGKNLITSYDDGTTIQNTYDVTGELISMAKTGSETVNYTYDSIGNVTSRGPPNKAVTYTYNSNGETTSVGYPNGLKVDYSYDISGNVSQVSTNDKALANYNYDKNNNLTSTTYGNGTTKNSAFDKLNRLTSIEVLNSNSKIYKRNLTFDADSYISSTQSIINEVTAQDKTYSYTKLGTISSVTDKLDPAAPKTDAYSYDFLNNLTKLGNSTYTYPTADTKLTSSNVSEIPSSYTYDNLGNRTLSTSAGKLTNYKWTADNKLSEVTKDEETLKYQYDSQGLLTLKSAINKGSEEFVWDTVSSSIPTLLSDSQFEYIYGPDSTPFAQVEKTSGKITYLYGDERNSVIAAADETGEKLWTRNYNEYGVLLNQTGDSDQYVAFGYAGEYLDKDTGLYNLRARWYEPSTASFINVDPAVRITGESYSYASGNPLSNTDPLGLWSQSDIMNAFAGGFDGIFGIPLAADFMNRIHPGSVNNCSELYLGSRGSGNIGNKMLENSTSISLVLFVTGAALSATGVGAAFGVPIALAGSALSTASAIDNFRQGKIEDGVLDSIGILPGLITVKVANNIRKSKKRHPSYNFS